MNFDLFLINLKEALKNPCILAQRKKNLDTLAELGLLEENIPEVLNSLEKDDYYKGPENDRDKPGDI